jgi:hypothetical protein
MQVNCPNCGERVTAEHINIQKMTAVCAACDTVFPFDLPEPQVKRRKVKQPAQLTMRDAESLQMEFRTNFRLDRSEAFLSSAFGGISMAIMGLLMGALRVPFVLTLVFMLIAAAFFYLLALTAFNKTHIEMSEEAIKVTRRPFPNPLNRGYEVPLAGVATIKYEETAISKKEAYDTPRYRVWAEMVDGSRRTIIDDVTEEYAVFIAQRLEEGLHMDTDPDVSRLEGGEQRLEDEVKMHEVGQVSRNNARR